MKYDTNGIFPYAHVSTSSASKNGAKRKEAMPGKIGGKPVELNVGHTLKQSHENLNPNRDYKKL